MRALIAELATSATVIVSTHILQEVQAVCERVVIMKRGRKVIDARLDTLQRSAGLVVTLDRDPAAVQPVLAAVPGLGALRLRARSGGRYEYLLEAGADAAAAVAEALHRAGFALHGLTPERRDLETVFAEVNRVDTPEAVHAR
jgi:ABC-2 type transport system ATP-binding protein